MLLKRLYPDIRGLARNSDSILATFFRQNLTDIDAPDYSHALRWRNGRRNGRFFSDDLQAEISRQAGNGWKDQLLPHFQDWDALSRAQYLEIKVFLSEYLLSSQGDRMGMANSIEGRFPFLDCRVVEFCNRLPGRLKLRGLTEKYLLKKLGQRLLPGEIWQRRKRPYRAPIHRSFFNNDTQDYVRDLLSAEKIHASGLFKPSAVVKLVEKIRQGLPIGESDDMALAGILSTQLVHSQFLTDFDRRPPVSFNANVKMCRGGSRKVTEWKD